MSHELRTPLSAILGYAQILERIEAGRFELHPGTLPLASFLKNLVENARFRSRGAGADIRLEILNDLPAEIYTDERYLRQILENLLNNAIKFTETGTITLRVVDMPGLPDSGAALPAGYTMQKTLRFEVEDTGIGIAQEEVSRIFSAFYRVQHARLTQEGSGLGLAICQRLVRLLGGELSVRSHINVGTTFWFDLALPVSDDGHDPGAFQGISLVTGYAGPPKTILIVEDNAAHRGFLRDLLEPLDFIVIEADSGETAVECAGNTPPDAALIDILLSGIDADWKPCANCAPDLRPRRWW
jgi:K+-sensing histidine kinase KdpD